MVTVSFKSDIDIDMKEEVYVAENEILVSTLNIEEIK
jgi:hypothetical protein